LSDRPSQSSIIQYVSSAGRDLYIVFEIGGAATESACSQCPLVGTYAKNELGERGSDFGLILLQKDLADLH